MPQKLFFSGNTLQQALLAAARHFRLEPEEIAFTQREKRHGFVKGPSKVVIEVDPAAPRRVHGAPRATPVAGDAARPVPQAAPRTGQGPMRAEVAGGPGPQPVRPEFSGSPAEAARTALGELLALGGLELDSAIREGEGGRLEIELWGRDEDLLVADDGELLQALEHLLPRTLRGVLGESVACRLDTRDFRRAHEERLERLARAAAEEVRSSGVAKRLPRMKPADRRVVHVTLAGEPGVTTESAGEGFLKTVVVHPA